MKVSTAAAPLASLLLSANAINAFVAPQGASSPTTASRGVVSTQLEAEKEGGRWGPVVTGVVFGWTMATSIASAAAVGPQAPTIAAQPDGLFGNGAPTTLLAGGAYIPEESYASMDLSMPKYTVEERAPPKVGSIIDSADDDSDAAAPAKKAKAAPSSKDKSSKAKVAAESEEAKAKAYFKQKEMKAAAVEKKAAIKAEVEAGRAAIKAAKDAAK